ncbi:MAG: hypothetical protein WCO58_02065 [bacterium]
MKFKLFLIILTIVLSVATSTTSFGQTNTTKETKPLQGYIVIGFADSATSNVIQHPYLHNTKDTLFPSDIYENNVLIVGKEMNLYNSPAMSYLDADLLEPGIKVKIISKPVFSKEFGVFTAKIIVQN